MDPSIKAGSRRSSSAGISELAPFSRFTMATMCVLALVIAWPRDSASWNTAGPATDGYLRDSVGGVDPELANFGENWQDLVVFAH